MHLVNWLKLLSILYWLHFVESKLSSQKSRVRSFSFVLRATPREVDHAGHARTGGMSVCFGVLLVVVVCLTVVVCRPLSGRARRLFSSLRLLSASSPFVAMQINIKKLDGQKEEFSLEPSDTVMKVKVGRQHTRTRGRELGLLNLFWPSVHFSLTALCSSPFALSALSGDARREDRCAQGPDSSDLQGQADGRRQGQTRTAARPARPTTAGVALTLALTSLLVFVRLAQTLSDQQVTAGSTVHMIMQMRGGC